MPKRPQNNKQSPSSGISLWVVAIIVVAIVAGVAIYLLRKPSASAPENSTATAPAPTTPVIPHQHIYSDTADPQADIAAGLAEAKREHKRVIIDFGGDWCGDCQVLDIYFHQQPNLQLLENNFVLVHVWIGHMDRNLDVAEKYGVPIHNGVPALAVLSPEGNVLYAQSAGEFRDMRHMESDSVTQFLEKWKG